MPESRLLDDFLKPPEEATLAVRLVDSSGLPVWLHYMAGFV